MSKQITSPVKRWPGSVTIADPLTIPQAQLIEAAMEAEPEPEEYKQARDAFLDAKKQFGDKDERTLQLGKEAVEIGSKFRVWLSVGDKKREPAILACVEKWELENFALVQSTLPASPRVDSHKLIDWIFGELRLVYFGEALVPNE